MPDGGRGVSYRTRYPFFQACRLYATDGGGLSFPPWVPVSDAADLGDTTASNQAERDEEGKECILAASDVCSLLTLCGRAGT